MHLFDVDKDAMKSVKKEAQETKGVPDDHIQLHESLTSLMDAFPQSQPRLLIMSLPHGPEVVDSVLRKIEGQLSEGDIILDGDNEYYKETERRQEWLKPKGVSFIGMGVSGASRSFKVATAPLLIMAYYRRLPGFSQRALYVSWRRLRSLQEG